MIDSHILPKNLYCIKLIGIIIVARSTTLKLLQKLELVYGNN